jgi:heme oxygenase
MNAPEKFLSVRHRLRAATDAVHQALHHAAPFTAIADGKVTREGYAQTLSMLYRFHAGQAPSCQRAAAVLALPQIADAHAARLDALRADIAWLDGAVPSGDAVPVLSNDACIGVLYTVQGSTLGGKILCRQLDSLLPDDNGRLFFKGTSDDGRHWPALCAALERHSGDIAQMEAGALSAFGRFQELLS